MNGCMYQPYLFMYRINDLKPEMEIQSTTWQPTGLQAGWRRKGSKSEHNINQTKVSEYSTRNGLYPTYAPNTIMLFSIQLIFCRQFNLILMLLVLRLFQSFYRLWFIVSTSETFRLFLVSSFCSCLAVRKAYAY